MSRPPRLGGGFRIAHLGVVGHFGGRRVDRFRRAVRQFVGRRLGLGAHLVALGGIGRVAVLAGLVLLVLLVALLAFVLVGFARTILAHVQAIEQVVNDVAEAALIVEHAFEAVEIAAGALLNQRTPQLDKLARRGRRGIAGQPLAHDHGQRVFDRRVGAIGDFVELAAMKLVVEHGGEIFGDPAHAPRADCLHPRLLDGLEHGARLLAARGELAMHRRIVAGEAERDGIGVAAHDRRFALVEPARRFRQPHLAAGQAGTLGGERHFQIALAGDGARAHADGAFERLGRRLFCVALRLDVGVHCGAFGADSISSAPR